MCVDPDNCDDLRAAVVEARLDLVTRDGLRAVSLSQIALEAGTGQATLHKCFPGVGPSSRAGTGRKLIPACGSSGGSLGTL